MKQFLLVIYCFLVISLHQESLSPALPVCQSGFILNQICISEQCSKEFLPKLDYWSGKDFCCFCFFLFVECHIESSRVAVQIRQYEENPNQYLEQPDCIQVALYTNKGLYFTRTQLDAENKKPLWPVINKYYNVIYQYTFRNFVITPNDFVTKCVKTLMNSESDEYTCYFELAFEVNSIAMAQHFFQIKANLSRDFTILSTTWVPFQDAIRDIACVQLPSGHFCTINPASSILFCSDQTCSKTSQTPFKQLYINDSFWIVHQLTDANFQNWTMSQGGVRFISQGIDHLPLDPVSTVNITATANKIIYQFRAEKEMRQIIISIRSKICSPQTGRQLESVFLKKRIKNLRHLENCQSSSMNATQLPFDILEAIRSICFLAICILFSFI